MTHAITTILCLHVVQLWNSSNSFMDKKSFLKHKKYWLISMPELIRSVNLSSIVQRNGNHTGLHLGKKHMENCVTLPEMVLCCYM